MMILLVAVVGLALAAALALRPRKPSDQDPAGWEGPGDLGRSAGSRRWGAAPTPGDPWEPGAPWRPRRVAEPPADPRATPATLEGILTAQRICGEISQLQYLRALEGLAARDEERHPLVVRWDDQPGACS